MGRRTEIVFEKLDKIDNHLNSIDTTLAAQHESLKDHMRRTELLEKEIEPVQKHVNQIQGVGKFLGWLSFAAMIAEAIRVWMVK